MKDIDEISKQLAAWHRSVEKRRTQQTDENENVTEE
jgi:hypothetical protein